jgi:hypothetical protein
MANFRHQDTGFAAGLLPRARATTTPTTGYDLATLPGERFLLFVTALVLPLENQFRIIPNVSIMFLIFILLAGYVTVNRLRCLDKIWMHPVFVAAYLFIGISASLEFAAPLSDYADIIRFTQMIAGGLVVASLCRDRAALRMLMYGLLGAALGVGFFLFLTSYSTLSGVVARDFGESSQAREEAFKDSALEGNINGMAFTCVQGGIVALAFALGSRRAGNRNFFTAIGIFCLVASSLPMSRGAIVNALVSVGVLLKSYGIKYGRVWLLTGVIAMSAVLLVPDAIWSRMTVATGEGAKESRATLYEHALQNVEDFWLTGVGAGNYYGNWGFKKGFAKMNADRYVVYGVHNSFLQLLINWGVVGLTAFLVIIWQAYRCLPERCGSDPLALSLLGIAVFLVLVLPFVHNFYEKAFSLGLGMLVAYQRWVTPSDGAQSVHR